MLRALGCTMAAAMHKAAALSASCSTARLSVTAAAAAPRRVALPSSLSPISQPWWRSLSSALSASSAVSKPSQWSRRSFAVRAEGEGAAPAAEPAEEAAPAEEAPAAEAVVPKTKALTKQVKHIMNILNQEAAKTLHAERNLPDLRPGDVVAMKVEVPENKRRVSLVRGIVIAKRNAGVNSTFRIRRIMAGVGVEMVFPLYSPNIKEIKVVDKRRARRAKLYYLRDKIARLSTVN